MPALSSTTPVVASSDDAIEPLLSQLFASQFVLTDRDGAVTRWSTAAQALLGFGPEAMAGQPLLEALAVGVSAPPLGGRLDAKLRRQDGLDLDVELTFVPVSMKLSLEFNGFLETLSSTMGMKDASGLLRRSHGPVIDWIDSALVGQARLEEDELMAGVIVAFRPTGEPLPSLLPAVAQAPEPGQDGGYAPPESVDEFSQIGLAIQEAALAAEEAQASVASAHVETAATAARVAGLEEYSDGLQRQLERTSSLVEEMRAELTGARAADPTGELRAEVERLSGELAAAGELRGELTEAQEKLRGITA
ncbi:MAG TPA: PAS domain-containing protein, partial [Thermoleophilaceae bacterium]|nr:PAS domain-containing protein [Thermoleophilaceae bacterium]